MVGDLVIDAYGGVWKLIVRIIIASICGYIIGMERRARSKEAGVRTHTIVCIASCLMMIISKYAFTDLGEDNHDASRIAAQIVSGIGFLGAGMIFYRRDILHGLTTAAGVWATAGIGMAIGSGMIIMGLVCTALIVLIQIVLHLHLASKKHNFSIMKAVIKVDDKNNLTKFKEIFRINKFLKFKTYRNGDECFAELEFMSRMVLSIEEIYEISNSNEYIVSLESNDEM